VLGGLYFVGYHAPSKLAVVPRTLRGVVRTTLQTLAVSLGPAGISVWPVSGIAAALLCGATACALAVVAVRGGAERARAAGLFACLASIGFVALGVGYGRATIGLDAGFPARYALLIVPALVCVFLACVLYGGAFVGRVVQVALFACACAAIGTNVEYGLEYARFRDGPADAFLADVAAGAPPEVLAQRYVPKLYPHGDLMTDRLAMLRAAGTGPYKNVSAGATYPQGPYREIHVPISVALTNQATVDGGVIRGVGSDPYVVYALPAPVYVCGIRVEYTVANDAGAPAETQVFWKLSSREEFDPDRRNCTFESAPGDRTETIWVFGEIDRVRIDPDTRPCEFRLSGLTLLVAE
jgi:hypothetical protein